MKLYTQKQKPFQQIAMKKITYKTQNFYNWFLITLVLLTTISIYCYLIKYWVRQKHLLLFHVTNDKLINEKLISVS